tara:strand:+ start:21568 stop:21909 length:342 start_codon:yes stop_codon:yes gene_type:complete
MHKDLVCEWKYSIFNKEHSIFNYELGIGASVRKRKSSFDGGAGMSGANAGGGCWLCSIENDQLGIVNQEYYYQHRSTQNSKLITQNSKLITQNFTSIHEEWIRRSDLRVLDMH